VAQPAPATIPWARQRWQLWADGAGCGGLVLFPLDIPGDERNALAAVLSEEECRRAARFLSAADGERHAVAHGRLRQLLAGLLETAPASLVFASGAHGKPQLAGATADSGLRFNLSHSGALGLIGWSRGREIGVDVEVWRAMRDEAALVRRFFSAAEIASWEALAPAARHAAFFNLWTRKEAYVKALGHGLALPLHSFDMSHEDGAGARLLRGAKLAGDDRRWSVAAPPAGPGMSLALVLEAGVCHIRSAA